MSVGAVFWCYSRVNQGYRGLEALTVQGAYGSVARVTLTTMIILIICYSGHLSMRSPNVCVYHLVLTNLYILSYTALKRFLFNCTLASPTINAPAARVAPVNMDSTR